MDLGIYAAIQDGGFLRYAVCPTWTGDACTCARDAAGRLRTPHRVLTYTATPAPQVDKDGNDVLDNEGHPVPSCTPEEWALRHAREALLTVQAEQAATPVALPDLKGVTL